VTCQRWHRRESFGLSRWRINTLFKWNGSWWAGDYSNGNLYLLEWGLVYEGDDIFPRSVRSGVMHNDGNRVFIHALRLTANTGLAAGDPDAYDAVTLSGDLLGGYVGSIYTGTYAARGGVPPYSFAVTSGAFPSGLTLAADGSWSGSPDVAGDFSWVVTATDMRGATGSLADAATMTAPSCGSPVVADGSGEFPAQFDVSLGNTTGTVDMRLVTGGVPDKVEVWFDGVKVIDTGYVGDTSYQTALNSALAAHGQSPSTIVQRVGTGVTIADDWDVGNWDTFTFTKSTATTSATVKVYSPMTPSNWKLAVSCPGGFP
jgi:hypothetical protein